jgi:uncharacterized protein (TIGR03083 family)
MDWGGIYAETRQRFGQLVRELPPDELTTVVPATPEWAVHDVVAHLAGVCADIQDGRMDGAPGPAWSAFQVEQRRASSLEDVLTEWERRAPGLEAMISERGPAMGFLVADVATHEQDVRAAVDRPGARDSAGMDASLQTFVAALDRKLREAALPALQLLAGTQEWTIGEGAVAATITADPFELTRALVGRRSRAQVEAFEWTGDPEPYLAVFSVFPPCETDLVE